mmetsp:Transcript_26529/g.12475  ORF Transcript_26529/g.12475 Transcript_26529/m.12475 type:complete len:102 (+) Transcript_26529:243-548(+)
MSVTNNEQSGVANHSALLYGFGDGGGGPTYEMLGKLDRIDKIVGLVNIKHKSIIETFQVLESSKLPVWIGELYFELHRGTYTTNGYMKYLNRKCELALYNV